MKAFDEEDAQLNLSKGTPRFYIMRLPAKEQGLSFTQITHHKDVTQCLGSLTPDAWYALALQGRDEGISMPNATAVALVITHLLLRFCRWVAGRT